MALRAKPLTGRTRRVAGNRGDFLAWARTDQGALYAHLASLVLGLLALLVLDRNRFFVWDEWAFFTFYHPWLEQGHWMNFLFAPYINHWILVPNLVWEAAYRLVGLKAYWVYLLPTLVGHVTLVGLVRVVLRRAGVRAWPATLLCLLALFTGAGADNLWLAWQIEFIGPLVFGVGQLLLSDHDGPIDRRDLAGLILGLIGLMCSSAALSLVVTVAANLALRRRWRALLLGVGPLLAVFGTWYWFYGRTGVPGLGIAFGPAPKFTLSALTIVPGFVEKGITTALDNLFGIPGIAVVVILGLLVLAGLERLSFRAPGFSAVWAMAIGGVAFFFITAYGRFTSGADFPVFTRYGYFAVILFLPLIGVIADRLLADRRLLLAMSVLFAWALFSNVLSLYSQVQAHTAEGKTLKSLLLARAADPNLAARDPHEGLPIPAASWVNNAVILHLRDEGALPSR